MLTLIITVAGDAITTANDQSGVFGSIPPEVTKGGTVAVVLFLVYLAWRALSQMQERHDKNSKEQQALFTTSIRDSTKEMSAAIDKVTTTCEAMVRRSEDRSDRQLERLERVITTGFKDTSTAISALDQHLNSVGPRREG